MISRIVTAALAFLMQIAVVGAEPHAPSYRLTDLIRLQQRYSSGVVYNFRNVILPRLDPADAKELAGVTFEFPLSLGKNEPFGFRAGGRTVVISIASLRFAEDIAMAATWLEDNGYSPATISNYALMLKYGKLGDHPPPPLDILCIPERDRTSASLIDQTSATLSEIAVFVTLHELGHIRHQHPGYHDVSPAQARANEAEADRFALDGMRRLETPPLAMVQYFVVMAHMAKNSADQAEDGQAANLQNLTHPLDSQRIAQLTATMKTDGGRMAIAAQMLENIAASLEHQDLHNIMNTIGATGLDYILAPRRSDEKLGTPCGLKPDGQAFSGPYDGIMSTQNGELGISLILNRNGNAVHGAASSGFAAYLVQGEIKGNALSYRWTAGTMTIEGLLNIESGGNLAGTWGMDGSATSGGTVKLQKRAKY